MKEVFEKYRKSIEENFKQWLEDNDYLPVDLTDEVMVNLADELFCFLTNPEEFSSIMDEIDNNGLLGEYDWCEEIED